MKKQTIGHLFAIISILIWSTTFISTKILLRTFTPMEILLYRFILGFLFLIIIYPKKLVLKEKTHEIYFIFAGLSGVSLYYLLENMALTYTNASNVGVLVSIAPLFTGLVSFIFLKQKLNKNFFYGFVCAIIGIILISFKDITTLEIHPIGDILAICAAFVWAFYSLLSTKISSLGYNMILATRRMFFYGIIFMIIMLPFFEFNFDLSLFNDKFIILNILFLSLFACSICFVIWNISIKILGVVKTSVYIYITPVITLIASFIILNEPITPIMTMGTFLVLCGLFLSEKKEH